MQEKISNRWFFAFFPYKTAFGAASVLVPLFVVSLGGTVAEVGLITAAFLSASIPASIFWAKLSDRIGRRKIFLYLAFLLTSVTFVLFALSTTVLELLVYNILQGFVITSCVTVSGMIIVESFPRARWEKEFGIFNFIGGIAWASGLLLGVISPDFRIFFLFCGFLLFLSFVLSLGWVKEPKITLERKSVRVPVAKPQRQLPAPIIHPPTFREIRRIGRTIKDGLEPNLPKYYLGTFIIFFGSTVLFTPLPIFMLDYGIAQNMIFLIFFVNSATAAAAYPIAARLSERWASSKLVTYASFFRCILFTALAATFILPENLTIYVMMLFLSVIGFTWSIIAVCGVALVPKLSAPTKESEGMGIYNAVIGLGSVIGAITGGITAHTCGYIPAFILSALTVAIGGVVFLKIRT